MKKQGVIHGAVILTVAGVLVKILGALFKIPLGALLGPEGNGIFSIAYNIYALIFVLATAGLPVAMSKTVAEAEARGQNSKDILKKAILPFGITGALGCAILLAGGKYFGEFMGAVSARYAISAIAPAVFFVSLSAIFRGYFQGLGNMLPTALSEVIEALGKLIFGILFAFLFRDNICFSSAGAAAGITLGALLSMLFLGVSGKRVTSKNKLPCGDGVVRNLLKTAIPITMGASVVSLSNVIDSALIMNILKGSDALRLFGAYNYAATVFNLPGFLVTTLGISLVPKVTASAVLGKYKETSKLCNTSMRFMVSMSAAAAGGLFALSEPILSLLYHGVEYDAILVSSRLLAIMAFAVPTLALSSLSASLLQATNDARKPMYAMAIGAAVKVFFNFLLVGRPETGIYGAAISTVICYGVTCGINLFFLGKKRELDIAFSRILIAPALSGVLPTLSSKFVFSCILPKSGNLTALIVAIGCSVLLWIACIMLFKVLTPVDIKRLFNQKGITFFSKNNKKIKKL